MKKSSVNTFTEGLVCDLDPINVPNNVLTDCLNGTIITYDGNEYSLQNDKGNYPLKDCKLHPGFIPVGIKEHGGIIYIVSLNPLTGEEEIGSYPSPKLYNGGTVDGDIDIDYVIDKAFEQANSEELDYSELESKCRSWYYADPKLKLNVGDKFWFEEELETVNFEKIEKYIIDENSMPHCISNDWLNNSLEYTSPISGTIMLKNKIFEFANSSAETNTFTCWTNNNEVNEGVLNNITSLFSFTHKLYIDDDDTLQWLTNDYLKYKVNIKVNDSIIYSDTFDGNSLISDSKTSGEYEIAIESRQATNLEWYSNNKIIAKYFVTVIKNIDSNDQISAEIIPIISISDSKNIVMSQFAKSLDNNVSEYTSTTWNLGDTYYRFYNHPSNGEYKTQYIELDIKGPIEASDDFVLNCEIYEYNAHNQIISKEFTPGIGKTILQIDYNNSFVKENAYDAEYSIIIAGIPIKTIKKSLVTSELFNSDDFTQYLDYSQIDNSLIFEKYFNRLIIDIACTPNAVSSNLPTSWYNYIHGGNDIFEQFPNSMTKSFVKNLPPDYKIQRMCGKIHTCDVDYNISRLLGPLWNEFKITVSCTDSLNKITNNVTTSCELPFGWIQNLKYSTKSKKFGHIEYYLDNNSDVKIYDLYAKKVDSKPTLYYNDEMLSQITSYQSSGAATYYLNPSYKNWFNEPLFKFNIHTSDNAVGDLPTQNYFSGTTGLVIKSHLTQDTVYNNYFGSTGSTHNSDVYFASGDILYISKIDNSFYNGQFVIIDDIDPAARIANECTFAFKFKLDSKIGNNTFNKELKVNVDSIEYSNTLDSEQIKSLCESSWNFASDFSTEYSDVLNVGTISNYYLDKKPLNSPFKVEDNMLKAAFVNRCAQQTCTNDTDKYVSRTIGLWYPNQFILPLIWYVKA